MAVMELQFPILSLVEEAEEEVLTMPPMEVLAEEPAAAAEE